MSKVVITPPGRLSLPHWQELWGAREVFLRFGQRDVLLRYRQTAVGVTWVILQPLVAAGIFSIIFGRIAGLSTDGVPYFLFSYISMLGWNLFSGVLYRAAPSLVANQALVSKVFFPRILVPASTILSVILDFVVALVLGVVLLVAFRVNPGIAALALPFWVLCTLCLSLGLGLAASAIMVRYRDVAYVLPWLVQIGLYATPVAYSLEAVPEQYRIFFDLNPMSWLLTGIRWSLLGTAPPPAWQLAGAVIVSAGALFAGLLVFQRFERSFADVI